ncbi:MAG TPA: PRC-barrel domain-containing protein [Gaiellaceae bacterium]|nr:PRC-barrel domain-containing protein [Gaiellaceae bacterium]
MADLVSWRVIERGWSVVDADGNEVGKVDRITGDVEHDIFDGLTVGDGGTVLTRPKYVPSEHVAEVREGMITLDLSAEAAARLEPYREQVEKPLADLAPAPAQERGGRGGGPFGGGGLLRILFGRRW